VAGKARTNTLKNTQKESGLHPKIFLHRKDKQLFSTKQNLFIHSFEKYHPKRSKTPPEIHQTHIEKYFFNQNNILNLPGTLK